MKLNKAKMPGTKIIHLIKFSLANKLPFNYFLLARLINLPPENDTVSTS